MLLYRKDNDQTYLTTLFRSILYTTTCWQHATLYTYYQISLTTYQLQRIIINQFTILHGTTGEQDLMAMFTNHRDHFGQSIQWNFSPIIQFFKRYFEEKKEILMGSAIGEMKFTRKASQVKYIAQDITINTLDLRYYLWNTGFSSFF